MIVGHDTVHKLLTRSNFKNTKTLYKETPCWVIEREEYDIPESYDDLNLVEYQERYINSSLSDMDSAKQLVLDLTSGDYEYPIGYYHDFNSKKTWNLLIQISEFGGLKLSHLFLFEDDGSENGTPVVMDDMNNLTYANTLSLRYGSLVI